MHICPKPTTNSILLLKANFVVQKELWNKTLFISLILNFYMIYLGCKIDFSDRMSKCFFIIVGVRCFA